MSSPYPSIYDPNPAQEDALILRLQYDLAMGMHDAETIAHRYGLDGKDALKEYLRLHPVIVFEARKLRALYLSDEATEVRIRNKFMHATEQLIIPMTALINDPRTPIAQRIDGFKQFQRGAGVDGAPAGELEPGAELEMGFEESVSKLAQLPGSNFYHRIREKFGKLA